MRIPRHRVLRIDVACRRRWVSWIGGLPWERLCKIRWRSRLVLRVICGWRIDTVLHNPVLHSSRLVLLQLEMRQVPLMSSLRVHRCERGGCRLHVSFW